MRPSFLLLLATMSGCNDTSTGNIRHDSVDPAISSALADPLMADPQLDRRSNDGALRPGDQPYQALVPPGEPAPRAGDFLPTIVGRVRAQVPDGFTGCNFDVRYSYGWAARLPADMELPNAAEVVEAAGSDVAQCSLRLVAYATTSAPTETIDRYRRVARAGGYAIREQQSSGASILGGLRRRDGAAFQVSVLPSGSGSAVDLVSNRGR